MGRLLLGNLLLAFAVVLLFASSPNYDLLLLVSTVASAGAAYFFWAAGRGCTLRFRIAAWSGLALATLNGVGALLGLVSEYFR